MESTTRWMNRSDMDVVSELRVSCGMREEILDKTVSDPRCICKVAESSGDIVGFMAYKNGKRRIRILEIAVHPEKIRRGVATNMLLSLASRVSFDIKSVEATVTEDNLAAQMLLKKVGFEAVEIIKSKNTSQYRFVLKALKSEVENA
jgi:ribosomal protein S18 acetylase RimI-like enzyme